MTIHSASPAATPVVDEKPAPATTPARRRRPPRSTASRILVTAGLAVAAVYFLFPVYWMIIASTKSTGSLFGSSGLWFSDPQFFENVASVFAVDGGVYLRWAGNSLLYSGLGAAVATLTSIAAGYAFAKMEFRGKEFSFGVVLAGVMIPATALALPLFLMATQFGLVNTYWAVLIPSMVSPFGVYLGRIYASAAVSDSLLEAARLDGAGEIRIFLTIVLRVMTPAAVTVFLFQFVGIWNNFFLPLVMLSDQNLYPITLGLTSWQSISDRNPEFYAMTVTGALLSVVPIMIAIASLQRFWRGGLTEGSVKG